MRLPLFIALFWPLACGAALPAGGLSTAGAASVQARPTTGSPTYLVNQNFEGTGYDNGESWTENEPGSSIVDEDYTGTVLKGSQSLRITCALGSASATATISAASEVYARFMFRSTTNAYAQFFAFQDNPLTTYAAAAYLNTDGKLSILVTGHDAVSTVNSISVDTTYYVWVHYKKGTGANSVASVAFATNTTEPTSGDNYAEITDGGSTVDVTDVVCKQGSDLNLIWIFDEVLVDNVAITAP